MFASGNRYWGLHGAAGLLLRARLPDGTAAVLLQHRAPWSHQGGTWALPGSADGGDYWSYTTVIADAAGLLETVPNRESSELRWVPVDEVRTLRLHPGFEDSWQRLRDKLAAIPLSP